ncbi:uroporphyrinogen-III C-methyltransferase [Lysobacter sp. D1-1-M9]|uniref:uroporphyrinogen-III C-methyltransferase n=1 Tax=Novilysobacter longmucuonensis TaxID=3098603 RepID=UPI002FCA741E
MSATPPPTASTAPPANPRKRSGGLLAKAVLWLLVLAMLGFAGWRGWAWWQTRHAQERAAVADADLRIEALDQRIDMIRRDQRAQVQRLQQADATNRVLRDELLGIGQRAALIEDSVARLADPERSGALALRLDETELLLVLGEQRLRLAGDLDGARRAYAMAGGVLERIDDPDYLSLRQSLLQERAALDELGADPRVHALVRIDRFAGTLEPPPTRAQRAPTATAPWWRRAFANVFDIQPRHRALAVRPADRADAQAGLQLELTLARAAAERRDLDSYRAALERAGHWLERLWPASPALDDKRRQLDAIAALPLSLSIPTLGSTLGQLRQLRAAEGRDQA